MFQNKSIYNPSLLMLILVNLITACAGDIAGTPDLYVEYGANGGYPIGNYSVNPADIIDVQWYDNLNTGQFGSYLGYFGVEILITLTDDVNIFPETYGFAYNTWEATPTTPSGYIIKNTEMLAVPFPGGRVFSLDFRIPSFLQTTGGTIVFDVIAGDVFGTIAQTGSNDGLPYFELDVLPEPASLGTILLGGMILVRKRLKR